MAYNNYNADTEAGTNKDTWGRQQYLLAMLTQAQMMVAYGESVQNPYIMADGCDRMNQILGMMIEEDAPVFDSEGKPVLMKNGQPKTEKVRGINTPTFKKYSSALAESRLLIQKSLDPRLKNRHEVRNRAYNIIRALRDELLQKASDMEIDFKKKPSVYDAWKE